jgi:hypothetical protein
MNKKNVTILATLGLLLVIALAIVLFGWLSKEVVSGKVMVVQRNAEVRKLALVRVYAVSEAEAKKWRDNVFRDCRNILDASANRRAAGIEERRRILAENDSSISRNELLLGEAVEMRDLAREFWIVDPNQPTKKKRFFEMISSKVVPSSREIEDDAMATRWDRCYESLRHSVVPELQQRLQRANERKEAELTLHDTTVARDLADLKKALNRAMSYEALTDIPSGVPVTSSVLSDDKGDFTIRVPKGDYYLFARGSRTVFDKDERYYWVKKVAVPSDESVRCLLGNNNMLDGEEAHLWSDLESLLRSHAELK